MSSSPCALPDTPLAAARTGLDACVHCGFCLPACPTYLTLEDENDSPRGRLVLMQRMLDGEIPLTDEPAARHIDRCLGCRGCETACPSGVPYGALLEATRATMAPPRGIPVLARLVLALFAHHRALQLALTMARLFRDTGLPRALARRLPRRLGFPLAMLAATRPTAPQGDGPGVGVGDAPSGVPSAALLRGCVMHGLYRHVNAATARAVAAHGFSLGDVPAQRCCGALHAHAGDLDTARALARTNIAAFEAVPAAVVVVNSAGCAAMMKQYPHLLHDDPAWADRAERHAARVRDVSELLASAGPVAGPRPVALRVTHDAPCHQQHAQRIVAPPLALLGAVPGLELVPLEESDQCCGAAGIYNLIEPAVSDAVLAPKLAHIQATGAQVVATGNPGCMMQIGAGLLLSGSAVRVRHPVELLADSYVADEASGAGYRPPSLNA